MGLILFSSFCLHSRAQTDNQCVVVEMTSGQQMEYLLSDLPRIVHNNTTVTLTTTKAIVELQTSEVAKVYVSTNATVAVREIKTDGNVLRSGNMVNLTGYKPNETVALYTTDGRLLKQQSTDDQGCLVISLSQLGAGIYIIKTKYQSVKITKK